MLPQEATSVADRLREVGGRIEAATRRSGRPAGSVRLVAVTKGKPPEAVAAAFDAGHRDFGENYVQELCHKARALEHLAGVRWHYIGRLQRNKARDVVRLATMLHAVDRVELVRELERRASVLGSSHLPVLIEVNVGGEAAKGGCRPEEVGVLLESFREAPHLELVGMMTIPPETERAEDGRRFFAQLRALRDAHGGAARLPELSMGMSHDFEVAIEEGATIVRVGTALFGSRAP